MKQSMDLCQTVTAWQLGTTKTEQGALFRHAKRTIHGNPVHNGHFLPFGSCKGIPACTLMASAMLVNVLLLSWLWLRFSRCRHSVCLRASPRARPPTSLIYTGRGATTQHFTSQCDTEQKLELNMSTEQAALLRTLAAAAVSCYWLAHAGTFARRCMRRLCLGKV
jgi:hypothetical protein